MPWRKERHKNDNAHLVLSQKKRYNNIKAQKTIDIY